MSTDTITNGTAEAAQAAATQVSTSSIQIQIAAKHLAIIGAGAVAYVAATKLTPWLRNRKAGSDS